MIEIDAVYRSVIIVGVGIDDVAGGLFFRLCNRFPVKMRGKGDDILISALMVHFTFADDKIGMNIGKRPVLYCFDKRADTAVTALAELLQAV